MNIVPCVWSSRFARAGRAARTELRIAGVCATGCRSRAARSVIRHLCLLWNLRCSPSLQKALHQSWPLAAIYESLPDGVGNLFVACEDRDLPLVNGFRGDNHRLRVIYVISGSPIPSILALPVPFSQSAHHCTAWNSLDTVDARRGRFAYAGVYAMLEHACIRHLLSGCQKCNLRSIYLSSFKAMARQYVPQYQAVRALSSSHWRGYRQDDSQVRQDTVTESFLLLLLHVLVR